MTSVIKHLKQAAGILSAPASAVSRTDNLRAWFKSNSYKPGKEFRLQKFKIKSPSRAMLRSLLWEIFISQDYSFDCKKAAPYIIDAGASIGGASLFFKLLYPDANILAFEPDPNSAEYFRQNIALNKLTGIELLPLALSSTSGSKVFYNSRKEANPHASLISDPSIKDRTTVSATRLSSHLSSPVDFLKLNVEKSELDVINELAEAEKLHLIHQMVIDWHPGTASLADLLLTLESNAFSFRIAADYPRPFSPAQDHGLLIYAFQPHIINKK